MNRFMILIILVTMTWGPAVGANPIHAQNYQESDLESMLYDSSHAVDEAWEAFHRAALGGTLASPAIQVDIELSLHRARELLMKGHDFVDAGDRESVILVSTEIKQITDKIKRESQRKKQ